MFWFCMCSFVLFFFNDTATTEIYTLSLHDALPILVQLRPVDEDRAATLVEHDAVQAIEKVGLVLDDGPAERSTPVLLRRVRLGEVVLRDEEVLRSELRVGVTVK